MVQRTLASAILAGLVVALALGSASTGHCGDKPEVRFTASPRISLGANTGSVITLRLVIMDATEDLWCPEIEWEWPNGTRSTELSDCDPFDQTTEKDRKWQSWSRRVRMPPGQWTFYVRIKRNDKTIRRLNAFVEVLG